MTIPALNYRDICLQSYLLGVLPPNAQTALEMCYFADDACFAQLLGVEEELIERYVGGELPPDERRFFENHYLTTASKRWRVRLVGELLRRA